MRGILATMVAITMMSGFVAAQDVPYNLYTDNEQNMGNGAEEWHQMGTISEIYTDASDGVASLEFVLAGTQWWAGGAWAFMQWAPMDLTGYNYMTIDCKMSNPGTIKNVMIEVAMVDTSIHASKFTFIPTTSWATYTMDMTGNAALDMSSVAEINYNVLGNAAGLTGTVLFDNIVLHTETPTGVRQSRRVAVAPAADRMLFQKSGAADVRIFSLNGSQIANYTVGVTANTPYSLANFTRNNLTKGAYIVKVRGAGVNVSQKLMK